MQAHISTHRSKHTDLAKPEAHTSTHPRTYAHIQPHIHADTHTYKRTYKHIQTLIHADTHTYKHTYKHTHTHTNTHIRAYAQIQAHIHTQTRNFSMRTKINFADKGFIIKTLFYGFFLLRTAILEGRQMKDMNLRFVFVMVDSRFIQRPQKRSRCNSLEFCIIRTGVIIDRAWRMVRCRPN